MLKSRHALALLLALLTDPLLHAHAQTQTLTLDAPHSEVHFTLPDVLHTVHGAFRVQPSTLTLDPAARKLFGTLQVDARSGESGNSTRDRRMTADELHGSTYTTVAFSPTTYTGDLPTTSADTTIQLKGLFTLLGASHEITVPLTLHLEAPHQLRATGTFPVPYVAWGLKDPSTLFLRVNKEVQIDLNLLLTLTP